MDGSQGGSRGSTIGVVVADDDEGTCSQPTHAHAGSSSSSAGAPAALSRYESQKRRDWNTFQQYLKNHKPPLCLQRCSGAHVIEFLKYLDQFGKTKVHLSGCPYFGHPTPPAPCACPLKQAWGSLDALIGRLRAAFEESGGRPESNPFAARAVRIYLREVRDSQSKARGIPYDKKKKRKRITASTAGQVEPLAPTLSALQDPPTPSTPGTPTPGGNPTSLPPPPPPPPTT